jgi:thiol-disulfide isomerase/thioredoxin
MNTSSRKLALALTLAVLCAGSAFGQWKAGDKLPALSGFGLGGVLPANLAGKVVMIDFWASWCGPCKKSFPVLESLHQKYASRGLILLAINVDEDDAKMKQFLKDHPSTFPVVRDSAQKIVESAGVEAMPSSFLVDSSGVIRFAHTGFQEESTPAELTQEIETLLGKGAGATP